ncbi:hypothetical protein [Halococcus qingdaonensis]|uniref:hypothetical protein n=1 Tax=Halococcus qingdaonensis TaxID=224402 RepID=UPI0021168CA4|nr:hypothetical protein [Halococcus qingdaonensis]
MDDLRQLSNEDELQTYLKERFERQGWTATREVNPDRSNLRVDLLLNHDTFGRIGIETKYVQKREGDTVLAEGHKQITHRYWDKPYQGEEILLWVLCPYLEGEYENEKSSYHRTLLKRRHQASESFCNQYGIGYLQLSTNFTSITYAPHVPKLRIPAFPVDDEIPYRSYETVDINFIRDAVASKRDWDDQ